jgi:hypothetical protein
MESSLERICETYCKIDRQPRRITNVAAVNHFWMLASLELLDVLAAELKR